ncbi:MAG: YHYH domain-containing protein [Schleiferiaceae bacterium]|nr:YHYH domain-containing protein [Schleiferiaceae bacterium]
MKNLIATTLIATVTATSAFAHGGGLNQNGCHNQHSNGTYHCHRPQQQQNNDVEWEKALGAVLLLGIIGNAITNASCDKEWRVVAENRTHMKVAEVNCRGQILQEQIIKK